MRFERTALAGVTIIHLDPQADERGFFARSFCPLEFAEAGLDFKPAQMNLSRNTEAFTLRGMHYQDAPHAEAKLVRVTQGRAFDVAIDLRRDSKSFRSWVAVELSAETGRALFVPEGCAHGFLTLEPATDVTYLMSRLYEPGHGKGVRWNDPAFAIQWPNTPSQISERDAAYPDFT